jgi:hypothetical protein
MLTAVINIRRHAVDSCSLPAELNLISILRPVDLNFGKDLDVPSKIEKGGFTIVSDTRRFRLEDANFGSVCSLLTAQLQRTGFKNSRVSKEIFSPLHISILIVPLPCKQL